MADRLLQGLVVGQAGRLGDALLGWDQPDSWRFGAVLSQRDQPDAFATVSSL
jgi:hypothetical protein